MDGDEVRLLFPMQSEQWHDTIAVREVSSGVRPEEKLSVRAKSARLAIQVLRRCSNRQHIATIVAVEGETPTSAL